MASEPIVTRAAADYPSRPEALTHARPRGSITEATLTSAMMMTSDVLTALLALWLASLIRFGDPSCRLVSYNVVSRFQIVQSGVFAVFHSNASDRQSAIRAIWSAEKAEVLA